jgi:hypothetical protein
MAAGEKVPIWLSPPDTAVYVVITTVNYEKAAADLPLLMMKKWLQQWFPITSKNKETEAKPRRDGSIVVAADSRKIAEAAIKHAKSFYEICNMQVTEMEQMNQSQGVIFGRNLLSEPTEALLQDLQKKNVTNIDRISSFKNGSLSPNGLHVLTFNTRKLPENILIGYVRYQVRQYFPRPLRCVRCCVYGHTKKNCKETDESCKDCATLKHEGQCTSPKKCLNCEGPHGSFDKNCPIFKREEAIIRLKIEQGVSFGYARKLYMEKVETTKETYSQMALEMAEEEAARLANEIESVKEKNERTELMKETLKKEIQKLEAATKEILHLQRRKNVLEGLLNEDSRHRGNQTPTIATPTQTQMESQIQETPFAPISQLSYPTQIPTTSQTNSSVRLTQLKTTLLKKTVREADTDDENLDEMEHESETTKRRNCNTSESDEEKEREKRKKFYKEDHTIDISDFESLTKNQRKQIRKEAIKLAENKNTEYPLYMKKGNKLVNMSARTRQLKEQAKAFHEWVLNETNPNNSE